MLDSLAASRKAAEYRRRADEARKTLEKIQEEIDMLHQAEGMSCRLTPPGDMVRASQELRRRSSTADPESPLAMDLQNKPWPPGFKMPRVVMFNGESNLREFVMSFEAALKSAGGDGTTLAKAFVLAIKGIARSWYSALPPGSISS